MCRVRTGILPCNTLTPLLRIMEVKPALHAPVHSECVIQCGLRHSTTRFPRPQERIRRVLSLAAFGTSVTTESRCGWQKFFPTFHIEIRARA